MKKPRIVVVNEHDEPIGVKVRDAVGPDDFYRVSAIWVDNPQGEILLAQRAFSKKHHPGKWGLSVVGTVDEGEDYIMNAIKEAREEIGLTIDPTLLSLGPKNTIRMSDRNFFCQWYWHTTSVSPDSLTRQIEEVEELRWVSLPRLRGWLKDSPDDFIESTPLWMDGLLEAYTQRVEHLITQRESFTRKRLSQ